MADILNLETVRTVAELARLKLSSDEELYFQKELGKVLDAFGTLTQVKIPDELAGDARSTFAMQQATQNGALAADSSSNMRPDTAQNTIQTQTFIANTPDSEGVFVRVPAILTHNN